MIYTNEKLEELRHRWTTPGGKKLIKTIKETRCYLSPVLFRQKIKRFPGINDQEVADSIDLRGATLAGFDFRVPVQEEDEGFTEEIAILSNIHFEGANLRHATFQDGKIHDCFFESADLTHSEFGNTTLNSCNFQEADLSGTNFHAAKLIDCDFLNSTIKDITTTATIVDQKTTFGKELKSEKDGSHHFASIEYKQIKEIYKNSSLHQIADHFHYREMVAKRRISKLTSPMRWLNFIFGDLLCKYGTSYIRVLAAAAAIITFCAFLFTTNESLLFQNEMIGHDFFNSLYFSIITFTTLGYGDFHAIGAMRFVAATESFLGAAIMSLFTVIIARQIIRD